MAQEIFLTRGRLRPEPESAGRVQPVVQVAARLAATICCAQLLEPSFYGAFSPAVRPFFPPTSSFRHHFRSSCIGGRRLLGPGRKWSQQRAVFGSAEASCGIDRYNIFEIE